MVGDFSKEWPRSRVDRYPTEVVPMRTEKRGERAVGQDEQTAAKPAAGATPLRGERNESSTLFSLASLARLEGRGAAPTAATAAKTATEPAAGESGLLD